ncbi:MAG TPA: hypothetical protein VLF18_22705 [Tahibacter sp.]|uniref:hypothetical protein n=1 Tax=Tahibacter sp. TaxID=2056211 RepID=UPI002D0FBBF0|nr:hypothetical protein [Tahibacter sp.]HSX63007.1 hypothetical protein [Tahibacter sp.]
MTTHYSSLRTRALRRYAACLSLIAAMAWAQDEVVTSGGPAVAPESCDYYEHAEFGGDRRNIRLGVNRKYVGDAWNDRISAIACADRCELTAFEHRDFAGASRRFAGGGAAQYVGSAWNDRISSLFVACDRESTQSNDCNWGPDTCAQGYVWREASPQDHVCVTPDVRDRTRAENGAAASRVAGHGHSGPNTCHPGFVWREAFAGDLVCVPPDSRERARVDNARASQRRSCRR